VNFNHLARGVERAAGSPWELVINTGTTIVTFLMVFLIQATQSRDTQAIQLKLDELIRVSAARNELISAEEIEPDQLERLKRELQRQAGDDTQ
jgi:low affinity Fe/Cu permease